MLGQLIGHINHFSRRRILLLILRYDDLRRLLLGLRMHLISLELLLLF